MADRRFVTDQGLMSYLGGSGYLQGEEMDISDIRPKWLSASIHGMDQTTFFIKFENPGNGTGAYNNGFSVDPNDDTKIIVPTGKYFISYMVGGFNGNVVDPEDLNTITPWIDGVQNSQYETLLPKQDTDIYFQFTGTFAANGGHVFQFKTHGFTTNEAEDPTNPNGVLGYILFQQVGP